MSAVAWLLLSEDRVDAPLVAALSDLAPEEPGGRGAPGPGWLHGWPDTPHRPHPQARRCAPRLLDAAGGTARVSLLWPDRGALPLYDDPAVAQARRAAQAGPWPRAVSTLTVDSVHFAGSLWLVDPGGDVDAVAGDPFRLLGRPRVVDVGPGLLGRLPRPAGPAQERYAGAPWPAEGFST